MKTKHIFAAAACGLLTSPLASAATFTLTTTDVAIVDDGQCSLIEAIDNANANSNANAPTADPFLGQTRSHDDCPAGDAGQEDVIELAAGTYTLTGPDNFWFGPTGLPPITTEIRIVGDAGSSVIERDMAAEKFRLFFVSGGQFPAPPNGLTNLPAGSLTLENLTVQNGLALGGNGGSGLSGGGAGAGMGGAIFNTGSVAVRGVSFVANTAEGGIGGAVDNAAQSGGGGGGIGGDGGNATSGAGGGGGFGGAGGDGAFNFDGGGGGGFRAQDSGTNGGIGGGPGGGPNGGGVAADGGYGGGGGGADGFSNNNGGAGGFGAGGGAGDFGAGSNGGVGGGGGGSFSTAAGGGNGGFGAGAGAPSDSPSASSSLFGGGAGGSFLGALDVRSGFGGGGNGSSGSGGGGAGMGGAIFNIDNAQLSAVNTTFSSNLAVGGLPGASGSAVGQPGLGLGGAVFNKDGVVDLIGVTMANNTAEAGGGLFVIQFDGQATATVQGSVLANSINASSDCENIGGNVDSSTASLIEANTGCGTPSLSADPELAGLADNGGPTLTHNPVSCTAVVVGAGNAALCADAAGINSLDQRGEARPTTSTCDIGAVELISTPSFTSTPVTSGTEHEDYQYNITGTDSTPGCTVTFAATTLPSWLTFTDNNNGTATLSGTPGDNDPGNHNVVLQITSSIGTQVSQSFTIVVANVNDQPAIVNPGILDATIGQLFGSQVQATDVDANDTLTITASNVPDWLTVTDNGNRSASLSGTAAEADFGLRVVQFRVEDQTGSSNTEPVSIRVSDGTDNTAIVSPIAVVNAEGGPGEIVAAGEFSIQNRGVSDHQVTALSISVSNPDNISRLLIDSTAGSVVVEPVLANNEIVISPAWDIAAVETLRVNVRAEISGGVAQGQVGQLSWGQPAIASLANGPGTVGLAPVLVLFGIIGLLAISGRSRVWASGALLITLLTACGGGGQSSPTPAANVASEITLRAITARNASNAAVQFQGLPAQLALVKKR